MVLAQRTGRSRYRLALLALTAVTLLTLDFRGFGPLDAAQRTVRDLLQPVATATDAVVGPVGDAWNAVFDYNELQAENEALRAELDLLRGRGIQDEADLEAYRRLLEATEIGYVGNVDRVTAAVVRGGVGNFDDHVVTIDKGSRHGLEPGMAVVTGAGFVGRLDRVDSDTATVELISSPDLAIGVRLASTGDIGLGRGDPEDPSRFVIDRGIRFPLDPTEPGALPEIGSSVVTSAESRYPADVPVGVVLDVGRDEVDGLTMVVAVEVVVDVDELAFVSVLMTAPDDDSPGVDGLPGIEDPPGVGPDGEGSP